MVLIMLQRVNHEYKTKTIGNASAQTPPPENPGHTNQPARGPPPPPPPKSLIIKFTIPLKYLRNF